MAARDRADDYLAQEIARIDGELVAIRKSIRTDIAEGVEAGIMRTIGNPEAWAAAGVAIQSQAKTRAGGWLFRSLAAIFSRAGWFVMAGVAVYTLGGWTAVVALFKSWLNSGTGT